jgi:Mrp family chromosome partitioning ATPase
MEDLMADIQADKQEGLAAHTNQITHVVGIMSGKGGVGKSLVTSLLACALRRAGHKVGILDADVTGPSIPTMFGITEHPETTEHGIYPVKTGSGILLISINLFLSHPGQAVVWRGPLLSNTVRQFYQDVFWGELDYLLIDLPPGTSDIPLTIMQSLPLEGMVIVTSPQDLAAMVVHKAVDMCEKMNIPVLGLVQNMAFLTCAHCGEANYPFGKVDGEETAEAMGVPHLLDMPLDPELSARSDAGTLEDYAANPLITETSTLVSRVQAAEAARKARAADEDNPAS